MAQQISLPRELLLMRHAKSDWEEAGLSDHQRPLNTRGRSTADQMARWLDEHSSVPDRVLCSTARRTCETLERMRCIWTIDPEIVHSDDLYHAPWDTLLRRIRCDGADAKRLMVLAHNPGMQELVSRFSGTMTGFPTAAIGRFQLADTVEWSNFRSVEQAVFVEILRPREL